MSEPEFRKEKVEKDDGRYIIFYTFGDEEKNGEKTERPELEEDLENGKRSER